MATPDPSVVDALFDRLCGLRSEDRERLLTQESHDDAVVEEVRRLLAFFDRPPASLDAPGLSHHEVAAIVAPDRIGPYEVTGVLGSGAMGIVYRARQERPMREVALKVLKPTLVPDGSQWRFEREAELLGRFQHQGIAHVFESGTASLGGIPVTYIAMEYVDGHPLGEHVKATSPSLVQRVGLLVELAEAVHHAHLRGVVHRDLKPSNVLVTAEGRIKVIDFGVARALDRGAEATLETLAGQVIGTLAYMSPEQVRGDIAAIDGRADVYALGAIGYEVLGGALPFDLSGTSVTSAARLICEADPRPLAELAPDCRDGLGWIVARAMAKEPERRYPSASALAEDLRRWLRQEAVEAGPDSARYRARRFVSRNRTAVAGAAATLLTVVLGAGLAVRQALVNAELAAREAKSAAEADELRILAEGRAAEIIRRTDPALLREALAEADELWPAIPAMLPAMERWLETDAEPLVSRLPEHRTALEELRRAALPYGETEREYDRSHNQVLPTLEELRLNLQQVRASLRGDVANIQAEAGSREEGLLETTKRELSAAIASAEARLGERWTWTFADPEQQRRHDLLEALVRDLAAFGHPETGTLADVRRRRERALSLEARTLLDPEPAAEWARAMQAIRTSPVYRGLELRPQPGLRPLGEDFASGLWEFWHVESGARPRTAEAGAVGAWDVDEETGIVLILIPGGHQWLGAQAGSTQLPNLDPAHLDMDSPLREVDLPPFFIARYECTQAQWARLGGGQPSGYPNTFTWWGVPAGDEVLHANTWWNPVEQVAYVDAVSVLRRGALRLPTLDEWEAAARGGTETPWWTGVDPESLALDPPGNLADAHSRAHGAPAHWTTEAWDDPWIVHAPVGSFPANPFGLHDTIGNVLEMCAEELLPGVQKGVTVVVGGSFDGGAGQARVTHRQFEAIDQPRPKVGVRPARSLCE